MTSKQCPIDVEVRRYFKVVWLLGRHSQSLPVSRGLEVQICGLSHHIRPYFLLVNSEGSAFNDKSPENC